MQKLLIRKISQRILTSDSDLDLFIESLYDQSNRLIFSKSRKHLLILSIISRKVKGIILRRGASISIIKQIWLFRQKRLSRKKLYILHTVLVRNLPHTVNLTQMLVNNWRNKLDKPWFHGLSSK